MLSQFPSFVGYALAVIGRFKYPVIFAGAFIEGPLLMIACGFLLHLGLFTFWPLYLALVFGDLAGDSVWYYLGYYFAEPFFRRHGKFLGVDLTTFEKVKKLFEKNHERILFFSKITMGFGLAIYVLMAAGASRVKFWKFMLINGLGEPIYVAIMLSIGYFLGHFYGIIAGGFKVGFIVIAAVIVVAFVYGMSRYLRGQVLK